MPPVPSLEDILRALTLPDFEAEAAQRLMAPRPRIFRRPRAREGVARVGGVLLLLYPSADGAEGLSFVLTKRTETVANHRGQVSFPGGANEPGETMEETALREAHEELQVPTSELSVIGRLTPIYIFPSDYEVHPIVAYTPARPDFRANPSEVAEILEKPLNVLLDDATKVEERWTIRGVEMDVPFYRLEGHAIWGATAMMLSEFEQRLKQVSGQGGKGG